MNPCITSPHIALTPDIASPDIKSPYITSHVISNLSIANPILISTKQQYSENRISELCIGTFSPVVFEPDSDAV